MYSDKALPIYGGSGSENNKCLSYPVLPRHSHQQQQQQQQQQQLLSTHPAVMVSQHCSIASMNPIVKSHYAPTASPEFSIFGTKTMVTDVGICFSMSNVNLNGDYPPYLGHPSLSALGKGYNYDTTWPVSSSSTAAATLAKYRSTTPAFHRPRNRSPPIGSASSRSPQTNAPYPVPYNDYYFAHPKIPIKIYNNHNHHLYHHTDPSPSASSTPSVAIATAYGQQMNNYLTYPSSGADRNKFLVADGTEQHQNARRTFLDSQCYDICMTKCRDRMQTAATEPPTADSPLDVVEDDDPASDESSDRTTDNDCERRRRPVACVDKPKDFSLKRRTDEPDDYSPEEEMLFNGDELMIDDGSQPTSVAPKKKWIRHYLKDDPLVNGHSTAPPLVVISTNGSNGSSSTNSTISSSSSHQKHHPASSLTIDLSTKSSSIGAGGHHLSSTPPSSGCSSSSSSTLTISPVDDSQSSLNLSNGSSGYITSSSANTSSSLNLSGSNSGSSPLPITINGNGSVITSSHGSDSPSLPHDLVIVQQQQQQQHLVQSGQLGLTNTGTLLGQIPTGGRRRTTSSNSNGVGTREVHNKLEKNRRAHLKECFEQLKKQLTLQPDEKKTSNLSILHAAIRHIQLLKRKERDYEHDMERLAKEKIAAQNRILLLKRELSQWGDVDFSRLATDTEVIIPGSNGVQSDRDLLNDPPGIAPGRNGIRYSSSSSLSSVATTASLGNLPLQTTISPVVMSGSSPLRASPPVSIRSTNSPAALPLSLTTKGSPNVSVVTTETHNGSPSPLKFTAGSLPNGINLSTANSIISSNGSSSSSSSSVSNSTFNASTAGNIGSGFSGTTTSAALPLIVGGNNLAAFSQSQLFTPVTATILTSGGGTSIQSLPLNLNVTSTVTNGSSQSHHTPINSVNGVSSSSPSLQIIGTTSNGTTIPAGLVSTSTGKELINGTMLPKNGFRTDGNKIEIIATPSSGGSSQLDPPATKVIKLVNGNTIVGLTSVDKVVQQGGIVVSPIQLLTSTQGLRVIQQSPNGLATIELSTPTNVQSQSNPTLRTTIGGNGSFNGTNSSTTSSLHLSSHPSSQPSQTSSHQQLQQQPIQQMTGAQLHKLLLSSTTTNGLNGYGTNGTSIVSNAAFPNGPAPNSATNTTITPELARLPGGAELNILPAGTNSTTALPLYRTTGQPGKLAFVNAISTGNGGNLTLKGTECTTSSTGRTAVHVVTPIQTSSGQLSGLTPVVVSRYDHSANLPALFTTASGPQTSAQLGKVGALLSRN
ncbi:serine-rich adhesin for platelets-like isoform X2 [Malaya genurostris]|uniref:serine-rich adhesin for platelets-like isoform X2 n=1 Tax=Malaya genurostris TaxID=325434 RepID=UPI0026F3B0F6|nr:serine-rich adhesin for platelets-like isoform X2 [Malaya genurostris]